MWTGTSHTLYWKVETFKHLTHINESAKTNIGKSDRYFMRVIHLLDKLGIEISFTQESSFVFKNNFVDSHFSEITHLLEPRIVTNSGVLKKTMLKKNLTVIAIVSVIFIIGCQSVTYNGATSLKGKTFHDLTINGHAILDDVTVDNVAKFSSALEAKNSKFNSIESVASVLIP